MYLTRFIIILIYLVLTSPLIRANGDQCYLSVAMHGQTWPCMAMYGHAWACMAMHGQPWRYISLK